MKATDIRWTIEAPARLEDVDVLMLDEAELLAHVEALRTEGAWIRQLLHVALAEVARLTTQLRRALTVTQDLRR